MKLSLIILLSLLNIGYCLCQEEDLKINNSSIAFTISEKDLLPESIAYDSKTKSFFIGSTRKGKVIKISNSGTEEDFINSKQDGLFMVIGIKADAKNRWLWVCSSGGSNLENYSQSNIQGRPAGVFKFDLDSGKLIKKYMLNKQGEIHFFNDLVIDDNGNVFVTHMFKTPSIYRILKDVDKLELFVNPPTLKYPNGITLSNNNKYLFVSHSEGILRIDTESKEVISLLNEQNLKISRLESLDGIYFYNNELIGIQPDIKTVQKFILNETLDSITANELLEVNHPIMNNPTTGVLVDGLLYYIANAQFGSFDKNGKLFPYNKLYEPTILRVKL